jgi:Putative transposase
MEGLSVPSRDRLKAMTLDAAEFIRRFLLHVLPSGFHRIRRGEEGLSRARPMGICGASSPASEVTTEPRN